MKKFKMTNIVFKNSIEFIETDPPKWLLSNEFKWWWDGYVLRLEIGEDIDSDFNNFKRIEDETWFEFMTRAKTNGLSPTRQEEIDNEKLNKKS